MMNEIQQSRRIIKLLGQLCEIAELHEKPEIQRMIKRRRLRLGLLEWRLELEAATLRDFDPTISRKLDALEILLKN